MAEATKVGSIYFDLDAKDNTLSSATEKASKKVEELDSKSKTASGSVNKLGNEMKATGDKAKGLGEDILGTTLTLVALIATLKTVIFDSVLTAARTETLGVAMEAVARSTGTSIKLLKEQEKALKQQGITTQEARSILTLFMQSNLDVAQASKIARVAQDAAVISGKNSSETARALTDGITNQNVLMLRSARINISAQQEYDKLADKLGRTSESLTTTERQTALLNGVLEAGQRISGAYETAMGTVGKKLTSLPRWIEEAANAIGGPLLGAFGEAIDAVTEFLKKITPENISKFKSELDKVGPVLYIIAGVVGGILVGAFIALVGAFIALGVAIWGALVPLLPFMAAGVALALVLKAVGNAIFGAQSGLIGFIGVLQIAFTLIVGVVKALWGLLTGGFEGVKNAVYETTGNIAKIVTSTNAKVAASAKKTSDEQIDANQDMTDKVIDNAKKLTSEQKKQLAEEEENFKDSMAKRKKSFQENLADLIFAHQDKVKTFKKDLEEENKDFEEANVERLTDAEDKITKETKDHDKKVDEIQTQIDKEVAHGKNASQTRLTLLRKDLADEIESYTEKVDDINSQVDKETAKALKAHTEKVNDLQIKLDAEQAILTAHQSAVDNIKDKAREDDIARLIRRNEEEVAEANKQHLKKMADIVKNSTAEGDQSIKSITDGILGQKGSLIGAMDGIGKDLSKSLSTNISDGAKEAGKKLVDDFINSVKSKIGGLLGDMLNKRQQPIVGGLVGDMINLLFPKNAQGTNNFQGGFTVVGEQGPELVNLPRGSDIIPNGTTMDILGKTGSKGLNQTIYINIDKVGGMQDVESMGRELGFRASRIPN